MRIQYKSKIYPVNHFDLSKGVYFILDNKKISEEDVESFILLPDEYLKIKKFKSVAETKKTIDKTE